MAFAYCAINHATYGGVYYSAALTSSGADPVWTKLSVVGLDNLLLHTFSVDPFIPSTRIYCILENGNVYRRNTIISDDWVEIMNLVDARLLVGVGAPPAIENGVTSISLDPTIPGVICLLYSYFAVGSGTSCFVLRSTDYGDSWISIPVTGAAWRGGYMVSCRGSQLWVSGNDQGSGANYWWSSSDLGLNWRQSGTDLFGSGGYADGQINPYDPTQLYSMRDANIGGTNIVDLCLLDDNGAFVTTATLQDATDLYQDNGIATRFNPASLEPFDCFWLDTGLSGHSRLLRINIGPNEARLYHTSDGFSTINAPATITGLATHVISCLTTAENEDHTKVYFSQIGGGNAKVWALADEDSVAASNRSGTNWNVAPYTDSVPSVGTMALYGLWSGIDPLVGTIYTYAVELGSIGVEEGIPMHGDRGVWEDVIYPTEHARDIAENLWLYHTNPADPPVAVFDPDSILTDDAGNVLVDDAGNVLIDDS